MEQISDILESMTDAFAALDHEWRFAYLNHQAERLLQRPREEVLGKNLWEVCPEAIGGKGYQELHRALAEHTPVEYEEYRPSLNVWLAVRAYPWRDGLAIHFEDITRRKQREESLRQSEERFRIMADNAPVMIWLADAEDRCTFFNRAWLGCEPSSRRS